MDSCFSASDNTFRGMCRVATTWQIETKKCTDIGYCALYGVVAFGRLGNTMGYRKWVRGPENVAAPSIAYVYLRISNSLGLILNRLLEHNIVWATELSKTGFSVHYTFSIGWTWDRAAHCASAIPRWASRPCVYDRNESFLYPAYGYPPSGVLPNSVEDNSNESL